MVNNMLSKSITSVNLYLHNNSIMVIINKRGVNLC